MIARRPLARSWQKTTCSWPASLRWSRAVEDAHAPLLSARGRRPREAGACRRGRCAPRQGNDGGQRPGVRASAHDGARWRTCGCTSRSPPSRATSGATGSSTSRPARAPTRPPAVRRASARPRCARWSAGRRAAVRPARSTRYVTEVDGVTLVCPWRTRLRSLEALEDFVADLPDVVVEAFLPRARGRAAAEELDAWRTEHPDCAAPALQHVAGAAALVRALRRRRARGQPRQLRRRGATRAAHRAGAGLPDRDVPGPAPDGPGARGAAPHRRGRRRDRRASRTSAAGWRSSTPARWSSSTTAAWCTCSTTPSSRRTSRPATSRSRWPSLAEGDADAGGRGVRARDGADEGAAGGRVGQLSPLQGLARRWPG